MPEDIILLGHGSGGQMTHDLINNVILPIINKGSGADIQEDAAMVVIPKGKVFFTTDSYVVDPFVFPGGNIGELAVNGTVNDLAMLGATPVAMSLGFILEEGLKIEDFKMTLGSIAKTAAEAKIDVACGDTKVVPRGCGDKIFINTSGIGVARSGVKISGGGAKPGDLIIINGTIGDHGIAIMSVREGLEFEAPVKSDTACLSGLVEALLDAEVEIHSLRDPTRGGLATTLVEIAESSGVSVTIDEKSIPISPPVAGACEILGLDPMHIANEGKMVAFVPERDAQKAMNVMLAHPLGGQAAIIGEVFEGQAGRVSVTSFVGGLRIVSKMPGELLPRIC